VKPEQDRGRLLTPEEAAERLRVSPETVKKWFRSGRLRGVKVSVLWRVWEKDLDAFIKENKQR